jgi:hypothetical protein
MNIGSPLVDCQIVEVVGLVKKMAWTENNKLEPANKKGTLILSALP